MLDLINSGQGETPMDGLTVIAAVLAFAGGNAVRTAIRKEVKESSRGGGTPISSR
jgi:hypothetical protein